MGRGNMKILYMLTALVSLWGKVNCQCNSVPLSLTASVSNNAVLQSPGYPVTYPDNQACSWLIDAGRSGRHVIISGLHIQLELDYDYVTIFDGNTLSDTILERFTGVHSGRWLKSSGQYLLISLVTDYSVAAPGFTMSYFAYDPLSPHDANPACGDEVYITVGETYQLASSDFPDSLIQGVRCDWTIRASGPGRIIGFKTLFSRFQDSFDDFDCHTDRISIFDGTSDTDTLLGFYCDKLDSPITRTFYTTGHLAHVTIQTIGNNLDRAFVLSYYELTSASIPTTAPPTTVEQVTSICESTTTLTIANGEEHFITSTTNWPLYYEKFEPFII
ncbi:hypothetical protein ScPMuIL_010395 [Solemya velum]